jgi:HAD superfamily hydrolase (TIGR01490 family)
LEVATAARAAAFFDVDKTILAENSGTLYLRARWDRGEVSLGTLASGLGSYLRYKLNLLDLERWTRATMAEFRGQSERALEREAGAWFESYVKPTIYPEAARLVREHESAGHVVALVSGTTRFVIRPLADHLGVEHVMHTHLEVRDGHFTGRVLDPICFGEGKIYWLQQLIEREGIDLARSWFYTDSITDLPLLELVGHPVATNPDPLLYLEARRRAWPIRFFADPRRRELTPGASTASPRSSASGQRRRSSPRPARS